MLSSFLIVRYHSETFELFQCEVAQDKFQILTFKAENYVKLWDEDKRS